jgi:addiction module toxin, relE/stbE family
MYKLAYAKSFKKDIKKLSKKDTDAVFEVLAKLAAGEPLESKFKDHALKGELAGYRDCHVLPDLVLIYQKLDDLLILRAVRTGSHSELF